jgi:hypothetical protein
LQVLDGLQVLDVESEHDPEICPSQEFAGLFSELGHSDDSPTWQDPQQWLNEDADDPGYQIMTDDEIVACVSEQNNFSTVSESDEDIEDSHPESLTMSHTVACESLDNVLKWLECRPDTDPYHILLVRKWRDEAAQKRAQSLKQTSLLAYFNKTN